MEEPNNAVVDMSSKTLNAEERKAKKLRLSADGDKKGDSKPQEEVLRSLKDFRLKRVLGEDSTAKTIFIEGAFDATEGKAVLILEKQAFGKDSVARILTEDTVLENNFTNNIYSSYNGFPKPELNGIKTTVIHPATEKHIEKYLFQPLYVVRETPTIYKDFVLPHLESQQFSIQWVYNILNHKSEAERIVYEDPDPLTGFVLLPDLKWNESDNSDLYLIAISACKDVKSLRDLNASHISLLKNIFDKSTEVISKKYSLSKCKLRAYLHYQPSYYHLHVHFTHISYAAPGIQPERAHLLDHVISNLELMPDYYQKATLTYAVKENDTLYDKLRRAGAFD